MPLQLVLMHARTIRRREQWATHEQNIVTYVVKGLDDRGSVIDSQGVFCMMVSTEGIEPPTCPLGGGRSIQLSYVDECGRMLPQGGWWG